MGLPTISPPISATDLESAKAYIASVNEAAKQRITIVRIADAVNLLWEARQSDPYGPIDQRQATSHEKVLLWAAKHKFVRDSEVWKEYMESEVGQHLENARWQAQHGREDRNIVVVE